MNAPKLTEAQRAALHQFDRFKKETLVRGAIANRSVIAVLVRRGWLVEDLPRRYRARYTRTDAGRAALRGES